MKFSWINPVKLKLLYKIFFSYLRPFKPIFSKWLVHLRARLFSSKARPTSFAEPIYLHVHTLLEKFISMAVVKGFRVSSLFFSLDFGVRNRRWDIGNNIILNLGFVSPCIIIHSNKSTNQMHQSLRFIARCPNTAQHVSGILLPIIRSL